MKISINPVFKYSLCQKFLTTSKEKVESQLKKFPLSKSTKVKLVLSDEKKPKNSKQKDFQCKVILNDFESGANIVVSKKSTRLPMAISKATKALVLKFKKKTTKNHFSSKKMISIRNLPYEEELAS